MSAETKGKKNGSKAVRKATFLVEESKGETVFRPVNKRAHKWARKVGKRTRLLKEDIKAIKATKKVKVYAYDKGVLRYVR